MAKTVQHFRQQSRPMTEPPHTTDHQQQDGHSADASLVDGLKNAASVSTSTTTAFATELPDDEKTLKRIWLTLLPTEQVIEILLKLDESLERDLEGDGKQDQPQPLWRAVRRDVWPGDLKAAVLHAAVAKIVESSGATTNGGASGKDAKSTTTRDGGTVNGQTSKSPPSPTTKATARAAIKAPQPSLPTPSTAPVPPLIPIRRPSPPTSTTTYQAAASASTSSYPYQPYGFGYSPPPTTLAARIPVAPPPSSTPAPPTQDDEDDLPSYEEMLVQALTVHNDPEGTAPKQLFQWMAATYPLQANFRPSASQALQKAFKRGRFEKNSEGRYRLNPRWEGGNTSRRTTRRPQSYSKSVLNPSPSSHPPPNTAQFPPQHYTWTYGGRGGAKSESPAPPSATATVPQINPASPLAPHVAGKHPSLEAEVADQDHESHRSCMEAAYSILQALNITGTGAGDVLSGPTKDTSSRPAANDTVSQTAMPTTANSLLQTPLSIPAITSTSAQANRAALQGSLALLAAQLAELADIPTTGTSSSSSKPTTAAVVAASAPTQGSIALAGLPGLASLEGLGINFLELAQLGSEVVEPAK